MFFIEVFETWRDLYPTVNLPLIYLRLSKTAIMDLRLEQWYLVDIQNSQ